MEILAVVARYRWLIFRFAECECFLCYWEQTFWFVFWSFDSVWNISLFLGIFLLDVWQGHTELKRRTTRSLTDSNQLANNRTNNSERKKDKKEKKHWIMFFFLNSKTLFCLLFNLLLKKKTRLKKKEQLLILEFKEFIFFILTQIAFIWIGISARKL